MSQNFSVKNLKTNKNGELTTQQIITITIIIISFIVLLFFLFRLNPAETSSKQICYNSVVLESKGSGLVGNLDCKTNYLTVAATGKNETLKALADEMADCWWMFGEGKIEYVDRGFFEAAVSNTKACALCSIIKFDEETQQEAPTISYSDLYNYLRTNQKSSSESYLQYIYSATSLDPFQAFYIQNYLSNNIDTSKEYFVLTGMSKSFLWSLFGNNHIPVTILEKTTENYNAVGCDEFITKAS